MSAGLRPGGSFSSQWQTCSPPDPPAHIGSAAPSHSRWRPACFPPIPCFALAYFFLSPFEWRVAATSYPLTTRLNKHSACRAAWHSPRRLDSLARQASYISFCLPAHKRKWIAFCRHDFNSSQQACRSICCRTSGRAVERTMNKRFSTSEQSAEMAQDCNMSLARPQAAAESLRQLSMPS